MEDEIDGTCNSHRGERNANKMLVGKPERTRRRLEHNKMDLK
jgi:hypothetical protein